MSSCHSSARVGAALGPSGLACVAVLVAHSAGCAGDWAVGVEPAVRDSAGVTVVVHPEEAPRALDLGGDPDLVIGDRGGEAYELARVGSVQPLGSGNVVVVELATDQLRFYDEEGTHVRTVRGELSGPRAMAAPSSLSTRADTLLAADHRLQRLLRFDTAGTFLHGRSLTPVFAADRPREGEVCVQPGFEGLMADGTFVSRGWSCVAPEAGLGLLPSRAALHVIGATSRDTVGTFTSAWVWAPTESPDSWVVPPFAPRATSVVGDDRIYVSRGESYRIEVYDASGTLQRVIGEAGAPPAVTQEYRAAFLEEAAFGYPEDVEFPDRLPAYARLMRADNGEIWALRFPLPGSDRQVWTVFSPDGLERRRIELPDLPWRAVGGGRVWGVRQVERNVHRVVAFDLGG